MKPLDEVIMCLEGCGHIDCDDCPYHYEDEKIEVDDCAQAYKDALHYLKKFKQISARLEKIALGNITETLEKLDNPTLTWDELKQMTGKPVWVEDNIDEPEDTTKYWAIYRRIDKAQETEYALLSDFYYDKAQYGKTWQAYRKERT